MKFSIILCKYIYTYFSIPRVKFTNSALRFVHSMYNSVRLHKFQYYPCETSGSVNIFIKIPYVLRLDKLQFCNV